MRAQMESFVKGMQNRIVEALEQVEGPDGGKFIRDKWLRKEGTVVCACVVR